MLEPQVHRFPDDPLVSSNCWANQVGRKLQCRVVAELGSQPFLGQLDAVTFHAREADFERVSIRAYRLHLNGFARRLRRRDNWLGGEIEGNTKHIRVLDVEQIALVQLIGLSAQCPPDYLFAKKLSAEGPYAEHMRHRISVPTLGQH